MIHPTPETCPSMNSPACILTSTIETPIGTLLAGAIPQGICLLEFGDGNRLEKQLNRLQRLFNATALPGKHPLLDQVECELIEYFQGIRQQFEVPLAYGGTHFQRAVWQALGSIPYGQTRTYEEMAAVIGFPRAVRAVGAANGLNSLSILVPCHRLVGKNGSLTGYGGGLWRKQWLLELEQRFNHPVKHRL